MNALVAAILVLSLAATAAPPSTYLDCVRAYRAGRVDAAVAELQKQAGQSQGARDADEWIESARRERRRDELEAALMLQTELVFTEWDDLLITIDPSLATSALSRHVVTLQRVYSAVTSLDRRTPFLRTWYLLWEAFCQGHNAPRLPMYADYLDLALRAFPDDAELLLAAGSRYEMYWWGTPDNPQRHPTSGSGSTAGDLLTARDWLRRSVAVAPPLIEARLRLGRVLTLTGDEQAARAALVAVNSSSTSARLKYLATLFLGDLAERQGDRVTAAAAYESAIGLVSVPQSARLAAAHLAYRDGDRRQAAALIVDALSTGLTETDPWWWYVRGQWSRFEGLLDNGRAMVRQRSSESQR
jgi:tetratricopeptide (TPR) repeat protein